jgi:hypothetical protein
MKSTEVSQLVVGSTFFGQTELAIPASWPARCVTNSDGTGMGGGGHHPNRVYSKKTGTCPLVSSLSQFDDENGFSPKSNPYIGVQFRYTYKNMFYFT